MRIEGRDHVGMREWIDFEHELRRRHLSSDEFTLSADEPVRVAGTRQRPRELVTVRHSRSGTARDYDAMTWKTDFIHDVHAGAF
jgi:hypothetical protein